MLSRFHFSGSTPTTVTVRNESIATSRVLIQLQSWTSGSGDPMQTGMALHTYADTFSHEGFTAWENKAKNDRGNTWLAPLGYVGHTNAGSAPDYPYLNSIRAIEAAMSIFRMIPSRCTCGSIEFSELERDLRSAISDGYGLNEQLRSRFIQEAIVRRFGDFPSYDKNDSN